MPVTVVDIPDLSAAAALSGTDFVPVTQGSDVPVKATVSGFWTYIQGQTWPAGSVSAPGVKVGDADTGFYQTSGKLHVAIDGVEALRGGSVGIACGAGFDATEALHVRRTGGSACRLLLEAEGGVSTLLGRYSSDASSPALVGRKYRGTVASPAVIAQNDKMLSIEGRAYDGSTLRNPSLLEFLVVAVTPSATDMEARAVLSLAAAGSVTATEIIRADHATGLSMFGANVVVDQNRHIALRSYTVATLPSAATAARLIYVSDGTSNKRMAVSDGTNWRWPDGAVVS